MKPAFSDRDRPGDPSPSTLLLPPDEGIEEELADWLSPWDGPAPGARFVDAAEESRLSPLRGSSALPPRVRASLEAVRDLGVIDVEDPASMHRALDVLAGAERRFRWLLGGRPGADLLLQRLAQDLLNLRCSEGVDFPRSCECLCRALARVGELARLEPGRGLRFRAGRGLPDCVVAQAG